MTDDTKNYITPGGYQRLQDELARLWKVERPQMVTTMAWAAGNGDRSENGDYIYGKKKLREIDRRIRYLSKSLDRAVVVDNAGKTQRPGLLRRDRDDPLRDRRRTRGHHRGRGRARCRRRARVVALSIGQGAAESEGRRNGDAARAARTRAPRDRRGSLR